MPPTFQMSRRHRPLAALACAALLAAALGAEPARAAETHAAPAAHATPVAAAGPADEAAPAASPAARAALEQLLGLPAAESAASSAAAEARTTTTVREGETLDRIIRRTLGNTPFKDNLLQAAFVEANPRAYPNGSIQRLPAGTVIHVPSAADLRRHLLRALGPDRAAAFAGQSPSAPPAPAAGSSSAHAAARPASASAPAAPARPDHRGWVRFPG